MLDSQSQTRAAKQIAQTEPVVESTSLRLRTFESKRWHPAQISRNGRLVAVAFIALGHALVIASTIAFAKIHDVILDSKQMRNDFSEVGPELIAFFPIVKATCYLVAVTHVLPLLHTTRSLARLLWIAPRKVFSIRHIRLSPTPSSLTTRRNQLSWLKRGWLGTSAFFSSYPIEIAQIRQLIELAMQTYQANKMSGLVATFWLNRLLACVIVVNCWFTPLVLLLMRRRPVFSRRVVRLAVDTVLDAVYSFGIPIVIVYPYWRDYVPSIQCFPYDFYVKDTWTAVAVAEMRQLFVSSWLDLLSKALPWFLFGYRLQALRNLISLRAKHISPALSRSRLSHLLNAVLVTWGFAVGVLHLQASWLNEASSVHGCLVQLRPWMARQYTCSIVELSCSQREIVGFTDEVARVLTSVDPGRVQGLIISHCSALEMPEATQTLSMVTFFKLYNTTIVNWDERAALTSRTNPLLQQFFVIRTNFSRFPEGLLSMVMPSILRDVKFIATNLSTLPLALAQSWCSVKYMVMEMNSLLDEVPEAIAHLPDLWFLSLNSNNIRYIPDTLLENITASQIRLVNNPLSVIPMSVGRPGLTISLVISYTNVADLPTFWLEHTKDEWNLGVFFLEAQHTPLCDGLQAAAGSDVIMVGRFRIECTDPGGWFQNLTYPLHDEDSWRMRNK